MEDKKDEMENSQPEIVPGQDNKEGQEEDQQYVHEQISEQDMQKSKKKRRWLVIGIILAAVIGIPLLLFGTCILLLNRSF
ncbi:MAG: hypothetical protein ACYCYI_13740 [Saccharofermentanales bacterium]